MNTYGLNRHLNSFGLSYPGYWFVIIVDDGEGSPLRTFLARSSRDYVTGTIVDVWEIFEDDSIEYIPTIELRTLITKPRAAYIAYRLPHEDEMYDH